MTTALTPTKMTRTGYDFNAGCVIPDVAGNTWANTGLEFIAVMNASGGPVNVTLHVNQTIDGASRSDPVVSVPASGALDQVTLIGPFPTGVYNDGSGNAKFTCSASSSIRVAVVQMQPTG